MFQHGQQPPPPAIHRHGSRDREKHHENHELHPQQHHGTSSNRLYSTIQAGNSVGLLKLMMEEVASIPYKTKKQHGASNDTEFIQKLIQEMNDILHHEFLHVDVGISTNRDVDDKDWSSLTACKRSESGTTGIIFLQCLTSQRSLEVVVAKATTIADYEKIEFVNQIANRYFHIQCPRVRLIERSENEFNELEGKVKSLFLPLNEELYELGGHHSPKDLFSSQGIVLLELVRGKPLCHKSQGQRCLSAADYHILGKLFFLDLLIRNTDRLPCRKAMPRPGSTGINDHGNAGNIMFGSMAGEVWSIDPEMQTKVEPAVELTYGDALDSVVCEITQQEVEQPRYKALESLFFSPIPGLSGILDVCLNDLSPWDGVSKEETNAISAILEMIRIRAAAEDNYISRRAGVEPPLSDDEREWREWIRKAAPRAIIDIFEFLEAITGFHTPPFAKNAFQSGFLESLEAAKRFKNDFENTSLTEISNLSMSPAGKRLDNIGIKESSIDVGFVFRMIDRANKYYNSELRNQFNRIAAEKRRKSKGGNHIV